MVPALGTKYSWWPILIWWPSYFHNTWLNGIALCQFAIMIKLYPLPLPMLDQMARASGSRRAPVLNMIILLDSVFIYYNM